MLTSASGWRAMFWINIPATLGGLWLVRRFVLPSLPRAGRGLDIAGQLAGALALLALTAAVVQSSIILYGVSLVAVAALVTIERRVRHPPLSPALFADRRLTGSVGVGLFINLAYYGSLLIAGLVLVGLLARGDVPYWVLIVPMGLAGLGISFSMVAATSAVVDAAAPEQAGLASGVLNAARQVGGALGVALLGALLDDGARWALWAGAAAYACALLCALTVGTPVRSGRASRAARSG